MQKIKEYGQEFKFDKPSFSFSLFFVLFILVQFYETEFSISGLENFVFSEATFKGVDIGKRVNFFYKLIVFGTLLLCLFYVLISTFFKRILFDLKQKRHISTFTFIGSFTIISSIVGVNSMAYTNLIAITIAFLILVYSISETKAFFLPLKSSLNLNFILACSLLVFFITGFFSSLSFYDQYALWFTIILLTVSGIYLLLNEVLKVKNSTIHLYLSSLSSLPVALFFSIEILMFVKLKHGYFINYTLVFFIIYGLVLFGIILLNRLKKRSNRNSKKLLSLFLYPSLIVSCVLLSSYSAIINQPDELFELANPTNAMMKIFSDHQIPFVDFMSSHMLSEQWTGIVYHLIYGYEGQLDFLIYNFFNLIFFYLIVYYFLGRLLKNSGLALLFTISMPFIAGVFSLKMFFVVFIFFLSLNLVKKQNVKQYLFFLSTIVLLIIWKLDVGAAALFSGLIFTPLLFFSARIKFNLLAFGKAVGILSLIIVGVLGIFFIFRSPTYIYDNLKIALHYAGANQAHGYSILAKSYPQQFWIYYALLPGISVLGILYILFKIRIDQTLKPVKLYRLYASMFFFVIFIVNAQRGLVRHSFKENKEDFLVSTFFLAAALLIFSPHSIVC